jgi:predicted amidophosphoribosyltransferase
MDRRLEGVPGFGLCGQCAYSRTGPFDLCSACARRTLAALADRSRRCRICDLAYEAGESWCRNQLCRTKRQFEWNRAIAMHSGELQIALRRYKYQGMYGWKMVFGRVLLGLLEENRELFAPFDLIISSPTYVSHRGRDHTRDVICEAAREARESDSWPFECDAPIISKTSATTPMARKTVQERRQIAEAELRPALRVTDPQRTAGRQILVYDDVFTEGATLNEVARALREQGGARRVCGVSLCRQPWSPKSA